jgi:hypothetical protein
MVYRSQILTVNMGLVDMQAFPVKVPRVRELPVQIQVCLRVVPVRDWEMEASKVRRTPTPLQVRVHKDNGPVTQVLTILIIGEVCFCYLGFGIVLTVLKVITDSNPRVNKGLPMYKWVKTNGFQTMCL